MSRQRKSVASGVSVDARRAFTAAMDEALAKDAGKLIRKAVSLALAGDLGALRLCMDRIAPPRKDAPISFEMPSIASVADHPSALAKVVEAVGRGDLTPSEGQAFAAILAEHRRAVDAVDIDRRLAALEGAHGHQ